VGAKAPTLREGLAIAAEALDSGRALGRLVDLIRATGGDPSRVEAHGYA